MQQEDLAGDEQQPHRLALFAGVFAAGLVGGVVFTGTLAHSQPARPAYVTQGSLAIDAQVPSWVADPSLPDAAAALAHALRERAEAAAPTF